MNSSRFLIRLTLPDYVTLFGGGVALCAIYAALHNAPWLSISLLFLGMLADAVDGKIARQTGILRPFGRYLDGFVDQLLYLVAPALLFYLGGFRGGWCGFTALMIGCGCIRLACFNESGNIEYKSVLAYRGMPVFWSLFILSLWKLTQLFVPASIHLPQLGLLLTLFSFAMISDRPFFKFSSLKIILLLCCSGFLLFGALHVRLTYG